MRRRNCHFLIWIQVVCILLISILSLSAVEELMMNTILYQFLFSGLGVIEPFLVTTDLRCRLLTILLAWMSPFILFSISYPFHVKYEPMAVQKPIQYWSLLNWQNLRLRCGCIAVPVNWIFDINSSFFAIFKNVVHSLEPGVTRRLTRLQTMCNVHKYSKIL